MRTRFIGVLVILVTSMHLHADVVRYAHGTRDAWFADAGAVGTIETITFTEHPVGLLHTQYQSSHGLIVTGNGGPSIYQSSGYLNDGFGMLASPAAGPVSVLLSFDRPMTAISADFQGTHSVELMNESGVFYSSLFWGPGGSGNFTGLISETPFTSVRFFRNSGVVSVDDLHFVAQVIPGPGVISVLMLTGMNRRRRRANGGP